MVPGERPYRYRHAVLRGGAGRTLVSRLLKRGRPRLPLRSATNNRADWADALLKAGTYLHGLREAVLP